MLRLNAELLDADSGTDWVRFDYHSKPRPIALLDRKPLSLELDTQAGSLDLLEAEGHWALRLPRGEHCVLLRF